MSELSLSLKINALVKGIKEVEQLGGEVQKLVASGAKQVPDPTKHLQDGAKKTSGILRDLKFELLGLVSLGAIASFVRSSLQEITKAESAFKGLESVANYTGIGIGRAFQEAQKLTADGLLKMADASKALQNLLARGYDLDQAVAVLNRLKDSAAFNRAAHLSLSEAVLTATEGLKNENSILVDNAGVTKNISVIWKEYAKTIGKSVDDLTQADKIQAEYNGILRETEAQMGNAAKAANGLQGEQAKLDKSFTDLKTSLGQELVPAFKTLAQWGKWVIDNVFNPLLIAVKIIGTAFAAVAVDIGNIFEAALSRDYSKLSSKLKRNAQDFKDAVDAIIADSQKQPGPSAPDPNAGADPEKRKAFVAGLSGPQEDKQATARFNLLKAAQEAELALQKDHLDRMQADYDYLFERSIVSFKHYYDARIDIQQRAIDAEINARRAELAEAQKIADTNKDEGKRLDAQGKAKTLTADITILERQRGDVAVRARQDQIKAEEGLAKTLDGLRARLLTLQGKTGEARAIELKNEFSETIKQLTAESQAAGIELANNLINIEQFRANLSQVQAEYDLALQRQQTAEKRIHNDRDAGLITETQARQQILDLHRQTANVLEGLIAEMERLALASDDPKAIENIRGLKEELRGMKVETNDAAKTINGSIETGFANIFKDIASGAKSSKEILLDFFGTIAKAMEEVLAKKFSEQLYEGIFNSSSSSGGGIGGFFASLFQINHSGGIAGNASQYRSVSPAVFLGAPRYHSGGIAGLAPDEVPSILRRGEEVLTAEDPRHRNNQTAAGGVTVNVFEAPGTSARVESQKDGEGMSLNIIIEKIEEGLARNVTRGEGALSDSLTNTYGLNRAAGSFR